jgi:hypothetical protein
MGGKLGVDSDGQVRVGVKQENKSLFLDCLPGFSTTITIFWGVT